MNIDSFLHKVIDVSTAVNGAAWRALGTKTWRSADGRVTPIDKMDDTHLRNTIAMVKRRPDGGKGDRMLPWLEAERERRAQAIHARRTEQRIAALEAIAHAPVPVVSPDELERVATGLRRRVSQLEDNQRTQLAPADNELGSRLDSAMRRIMVLETVVVTRAMLQLALGRVAGELRTTGVSPLAASVRLCKSLATALGYSYK
jgi:hypothetical protein